MDSISPGPFLAGHGRDRLAAPTMEPRWSALVSAGTDQADAAGLPCFLETGTAENVAYDARRGVEVVGQAEVEGFTLYGMVRPPA